VLDLPYNVPYDCLLVAQLHHHSLDEDGSYANHRSQVQFFKISALSLILCASIVSENVSLKYLPISFNQAIGATTPFFTAVFGYLIALKGKLGSPKSPSPVSSLLAGN